MTFTLGLIIGASIGAPFGFLLMACFAAGAKADARSGRG